MRNKLRETRLRKLMSQEELSKASGVCRTVISHLEQNPEKNVSMITVLKLAMALEVSPLDLFTP